MAEGRDFQGMYYSFRNKAKGLAARVRELEDALAKKSQESEHRYELLKKVNSAYKELEQSPRLTDEEYQQYQNVIAHQQWTQHVQAFESALENVLAPGVTAEQVLRAVGYDPAQVTELTPDLVQGLFEYASDQIPAFFKNGGYEAEDEPQATDDTPEVLNTVDTFKAAFEAGSVASQQQQNGFTQSGTERNGYDASVQSDVRPQMAQHQSAPQTPAAEFRGFGQVASRGGPSPTKVAAVGAHLRDPVWIANNQGALAEAVKEGVRVVNVDSK
jgi:hypothetical protein